MRKRLIIADDHVLLLEGLSRLLEKDYEVVASVNNGSDLVAASLRLKPDIVILDISMPTLNGVEAARQLRGKGATAKIVFLTQRCDVDVMRAAFEAGASAFVSKQAQSGEIFEAICQVLRGRFYVSPSLCTNERHHLYDPRENAPAFFGRELTGRQRQVLQLLAEGKAMKQISLALNISVKTVEFHKAGLMGELSLRTTAELIRYAVTQGIVS